MPVIGTTLDILHGERRAADHSANIGSRAVPLPRSVEGAGRPSIGNFDHGMRDREKVIEDQCVRLSPALVNCANRDFLVCKDGVNQRPGRSIIKASIDCSQPRLIAAVETI